MTMVLIRGKLHDCQRSKFRGDRACPNRCSGDRNTGGCGKQQVGEQDGLSQSWPIFVLHQLRVALDGGSADLDHCDGVVLTQRRLREVWKTSVFMTGLGIAFLLIGGVVFETCLPWNSDARSVSERVFSG